MIDRFLNEDLKLHFVCSVALGLPNPLRGPDDVRLRSSVYTKSGFDIHDCVSELAL